MFFIYDQMFRPGKRTYLCLLTRLNIRLFDNPMELEGRGYRRKPVRFERQGNTYRIDSPKKRIAWGPAEEAWPPVVGVGVAHTRVSPVLYAWDFHTVSAGGSGWLGDVQVI